MNIAQDTLDTFDRLQVTTAIQVPQIKITQSVSRLNRQVKQAAQLERQIQLLRSRNTA